MLVYCLNRIITAITTNKQVNQLSQSCFLQMIGIKFNMGFKEDIPNDEINHGKRNTPSHNTRKNWPGRFTLFVVIIYNSTTSKLQMSESDIRKNTYDEIVKCVQGDERQENNPRPLYSRRSRVNIRSIQNSLVHECFHERNINDRSLNNVTNKTIGTNVTNSYEYLLLHTYNQSAIL